MLCQLRRSPRRRNQKCCRLCGRCCAACVLCAIFRGQGTCPVLGVKHSCNILQDGLLYPPVFPLSFQRMTVQHAPTHRPLQGGVPRRGLQRVPWAAAALLPGWQRRQLGSGDGEGCAAASRHAKHLATYLRRSNTAGVDSLKHSCPAAWWLGRSKVPARAIVWHRCSCHCRDQAMRDPPGSWTRCLIEELPNRRTAVRMHLSNTVVRRPHRAAGCIDVSWPPFTDAGRHGGDRFEHDPSRHVEMHPINLRAATKY